MLAEAPVVLVSMATTSALVSAAARATPVTADLISDAFTDTECRTSPTEASK